MTAQSTLQDYDRVTSKLRQYSPGIAGAMFGAAWWCWCALQLLAQVLHYVTYS